MTNTIDHNSKETVANKTIVEVVDLMDILLRIATNHNEILVSDES